MLSAQAFTKGMLAAWLTIWAIHWTFRLFILEKMGEKSLMSTSNRSIKGTSSPAPSRSFFQIRGVIFRPFGIFGQNGEFLVTQRPVDKFLQKFEGPLLLAVGVDHVPEIVFVLGIVLFDIVGQVEEKRTPVDKKTIL